MPLRYTATLVVLGAIALGVLIAKLELGSWAIIVGSVALSAPLAEQVARRLDSRRR